MLPKHFTIPVFIPMEACPFHCIYCDQQKISGHVKMPETEEIPRTIKAHLSTIPLDADVQVGFFGGTFTGLDTEVQKAYLDAVKPFIREGSIKSIRLSTRPDFITPEILELLKIRHVETIELGAQSMDDEVLRKSGRGHKAVVAEEASEMIRDFGFRLGLQMMIGLPGDTPEKSVFTAHKFVELGAKDVRIYPTLVIAGTPLEKLYHKGKYEPLSLNEAVQQTAVLFPVFEEAGINIIRTGLHPSEGLLDKTDLVAGPFHVSFKELVLTRLWQSKFKHMESLHKNIEIFVATKQMNAAIGYSGQNKKMLLKKFDSVKFHTDPSLKNREFYVDYCR